MSTIQKMLGSSRLMIILLVLIIITFVYFHFFHNKIHEGFYPVTNERINFERETGKRRYNDYSDTVDPEKAGVIPNGAEGDILLNKLLLTPDYEGSKNTETSGGLTFVNELKYKAPPLNSDILERILLCERLQTWNCESLSDPKFKQYCGICTSNGQDHLGNKHIGGLYIDPEVKAKAMSEVKNGEKYVVEPTAGTCSGEFITERPYCDVQKDRYECSTVQGFEDKIGQSKCALCANSPGGNQYVYVGSRGNEDVNYKLYGNPTQFKIRLRFAVTHPSEATIVVTRSEDNKVFNGSFIIGTNTYIVDLPNASENERYNIKIRYPEYKDHQFTSEEATRIKNMSTPRYAPLQNAFYGPVIDGDNGFLKDDPRAIDVTDTIKSLNIKDCSRTKIPVGVDTIGKDPTPGVEKQLRLVYSNDSIEFAYAYGQDGSQTSSVDTKSFDTLCSPPISKSLAEKQVCENDIDGNFIPNRIYSGGNNTGYFGTSSKIQCVQTIKPTARGIVGVWESVGKVPRTVPLDISVVRVNGYDVGDEGVRTLGTLKGSSIFKKLVTPSLAVNIPQNLFWFWAKQSTLTNCDFTVQVPATLRDPSVAEDLKLCPTGPLIVTKEAATNLGQGACEKLVNGKPQGPGNYSDDCIRSLFLSLGCSVEGKAYPNTREKVMSFTVDSLTKSDNSIDTITDNITNLHTVATTGKNTDGLVVEQSSYVKATLDCFGTTITNPCDTAFKDSGPQKPDCLDYLFRNAGKDNQSIGQTYPGMYNRSSGTDRIDKAPIMYCQRTGSLSPYGADGKINDDAVSQANSYGSVQAIREFYRQVHADANFNQDSVKQQNALMKCYGVGVVSKKSICKGIFARYVAIRPSYKSDNIIQISQLEVYDVNGNNVSAKQPTKSSIPYEPTQSASAVDGRAAVREFPDLFSSQNDNTLDKSQTYWMVDLGKSTEVSYVMYYNRVSYSNRAIGMRLQLLDENKILVKQKTFSGGLIETVLFSDVKPSGLLRTGTKVSFSPGRFSGSKLSITAGGEVLIRRQNAGGEDTSFIALAGNAPVPGSFSFKHASSERYIRVQGFRIRVADDDGTNAFKSETTFVVSDSLAGNPGEVSYESVSTPGNYLCVSDNMGVYLTKVNSPIDKRNCSWITSS